MVLSDLLMQYPGKASINGEKWLPLWMHGMDTTEIMKRLLKNWLPRQILSACNIECCELEKLSCFIALVHDIGKLTPAFAARILAHLPEKKMKLERGGLPVDALKCYSDAGQTPHAKAGEAVLLSYGIPAGIAAIVGAHHGKPQESGRQCIKNLNAYAKNYYESDHMRETWESLRKDFLSWALTKAGYETADEIPEPKQPTQVLLTGLLVMADWIASNESYFPYISCEENADEGEYPARTDFAWGKLHLPEPWSPLSFAMDDYAFAEIFGFSPNSVQTMVINAVNEESSGLFILEAQMGVGKTEAALAAAEVLASKNGSGGIFFGLPTQATANGIFPRLLNWAENQTQDAQLAIRLAHGMAELNEEYRSLFHGTSIVCEDGEQNEHLIVHPWFNGRKQALLSDFVIGTVDQLLMAALKQKHVMLRHLGLSGKVVILDECHAYDAYMNQYLDRALNWLGVYHVPVIVLSATLPEQRRAAMIEAYANGKVDEPDNKWRTERAYPLLTWTDGRTVHQCTTAIAQASRSIEIRNLDTSCLVSQLRKLTEGGACCGIIVNTVRAAQDLARKITEEMPNAEMLLFHSRFIATDRAEKESLLLQRAGKKSTAQGRSGLIVVGTQVLEQSLDIDFDVLFTQLCPMDLLMQRLGRMFRHERMRPALCKKAICYILDWNKEADEGSRAVYGDWLLLRTRELLPAVVHIPDSIPELVQATYQAPGDAELFDETHLRAWEAHDNIINVKRQKAGNYRIAPPKICDGRRVATIDGWLNADMADGARGDAAVRDGEPNISVLAMQKHKDGRVSFPPWQEGGREVSAGHAPDDETARQIARQKLTLPLSFSLYGRDEQTIRELEDRNRRELPEWQNSGWLSGELILLLDDTLSAELCGQRIRYSEQFGLLCERKGGEQ